jgi:hypothetical protein
MPSLDNPHFTKSVKSLTLPSANQEVMVWDVELQSTSDELTVPGLKSTFHPITGSETVDVPVSVTNGISVAAGAINSGGDVTLTITGGSLGVRATIITAHRVGLSNLTSRPAVA